MQKNEAKGSIQSKIDPFASFVCNTTDNCDNSYVKWNTYFFAKIKLCFFSGVFVSRINSCNLQSYK